MHEINACSPGNIGEPHNTRRRNRFRWRGCRWRDDSARPSIRNRLLPQCQKQRDRDRDERDHANGTPESARDELVITRDLASVCRLIRRRLARFVRWHAPTLPDHRAPHLHVVPDDEAVEFFAACEEHASACAFGEAMRELHVVLSL